MIKIVLKMLIIGIALIGPAFASTEVTCSQTIYAFPNQHIELRADTSGSGSYTYSWYESDQAWDGIKEAGEAAIKNQNIIKFDAPSTTGTYKIYVMVQEASASSCVDIDCYTIQVIKCCPNLGPYCESETGLSLCWYEKCYTETNVPTLVHPTTLTYSWYVNKQPGVGVTADYTGPCFTPTFTAAPWLSPATTGAVDNTVILQVTQIPQSGSRHTVPILLYTCASDSVQIYAAPDTQIGVVN